MNLRNIFLLLALALMVPLPAGAQALGGGGLGVFGGGSGGGGTTITSGAGDFGAATSQSGAVLTGVVANVPSTATMTTPPAIGGTTPNAGAFTTLSASSTVSGAGFTGTTFGASLNLSTLLSQDCTVSGAGVVTCTKAGNGTGTFTAGKLVAGAASVGDPAIQLNKSSGNQSCIGLNNGTTDILCDTNSGNFNVQLGGTNRFSFLSNGQIQITGDNAVTSMARMPLSFGTGNLTVSGLNGNNFAVYKAVKALTLENLEGVSIVDTSCTGGSTITIYDCGASAPTNANCSGGTAKANVTLSTTVGTATDGSVTSANVAAGEYLGAQISTIGTGCTVLNAVITAMARPQ